MQALAKNALNKLEGNKVGDDIQTLAKKALRRIDGMKSGDNIEALAKDALKNIGGGSLVQTTGDDGIVFKGDLKTTLGHLTGKGLDQFVEQTQKFAMKALGDVEETSNKKAKKFLLDA